MKMNNFEKNEKSELETMLMTHYKISNIPTILHTVNGTTASLTSETSQKYVFTLKTYENKMLGNLTIIK